MSLSNHPAVDSDYGEIKQDKKSAESNFTDDQEIPQQPQQTPPPKGLSSSFQMQPPPSKIYSESIPTVDSSLLRYTSTNSSSRQTLHEYPDSTGHDNDLNKQASRRTPEGKSVIDPDSVLGDSGRWYHGYKDGKYLLPNDSAEQNRLDLQHQVWLLLLDKWLHLAPMTTVPKYVLDVATGTGIWAHDFAEKYPSSFVIGTDLSAIQPEPRVSNLLFQKDDAEAPWKFPAHHPAGEKCMSPCEHRIMFDYVHLRAVVTCFDDHLTVMQHAFDNMNPGAWIEFQDASFHVENDGTSEDSPFKKYLDGCIRGAATIGRNLRVPERYKAYLERIGFVDVQERSMIMPANGWAKDPRLREAGLYNLQNMLDGIRTIGWKMLIAAGYTADEVERLVEEAREWITDCNSHPYNRMYVVYGRKPLT